MANILEKIFQFFKLTEVKAENLQNENIPELCEEMRKPARIWPRLLAFPPNQPPCEAETEVQEIRCPIHDPDPCDDEDEEQRGEEEQQQQQQPEKPCPKPCVTFARRLGCMCEGARFGVKDGTLTGIFLGGSWGIYKYVDKVYLKGEGGDSGGSSGDDETSTLNDSTIFVSAANGALAMAVFCTLFCCMKSAFYCQAIN